MTAGLVADPDAGLDLDAHGFAWLLDALGFAADDPVSVCHRSPGGAFAVTRTTAAEAPQVALALGHEVDLWFGVNGLRQVAAGRGSAADVVRLRALYADLDVKPGGLASERVAAAVVADLSALLGSRPVAVTHSGHGLQPLWVVDPDDPAGDLDDATRPGAVALLRRWGRLVAHVAERHGGRVDSVFDLARVLRVPGSTNVKDPARPVRVRVVDTGGSPLTVAEVDEQLAAYGAVERDGDRDAIGPVQAPATDWAWAERTHPAVERAVASWAAQTPTARHPWLVGCSTSLALARRLGMVTEAGHDAAVRALAERFGWLLAQRQPVRPPAPGEVAGALAFGVAKAQTLTEQAARADWAFWTAAAERGAPTVDPGAAEAFWTARPVLDHLRTAARARRCSPWAVLGVALARVVAAAPPQLVLPALVGGEASLNLYAGIVGASGDGKGAAEAAAADALRLPWFEQVGVGSGEGIAHCFMRRTKDDVEQHTTAVLLSVAEVDTIAGLTERQGSTLLPELRKAWTGERLGFAYADPKKRLPVPRHAYRLCLVVGIQPRRAGGLLDDRDGGTPQRFLWLPATDPDAPDVAPAEPEPLTPGYATRPPKGPSGLHPLPVCEAARAEVDGARLPRLRGTGEALDGHLPLARLKVAAALALLDGRAEVADDDWALARVVLDVSTTTRAAVVAELSRAAGERNRGRAEAEAERAVVVADRVEDDALRRVARRVVARLAGGDWMPRNELRKRIAARDRGHFDDALRRAVEAGQVEVEADEHGERYRLAGGTR